MLDLLAQGGEQIFTMTPTERLSSMNPLELAQIRDRLAVQRPLHWSEALRLVEALEAAWSELQKKQRPLAPKTKEPTGLAAGSSLPDPF